MGKKPAAAPLKGGKKKAASFVIDCSKPVDDKIMKIAEFEKFLVDKIKVDNKVGTRSRAHVSPSMQRSPIRCCCCAAHGAGHVACCSQRGTDEGCMQASWATT